MIELNKIDLGENGEGFYLITNEGVISFIKDNVDLYIRPDSGFGINDKDLNKRDYYSFVITKENEEIYYIIDEVYKAVKERKPYSNSVYNFDEKDYILPHYIDVSDENKLFKDDKVSWHSDDLLYDEASVFYIESKDDNYILSFKQSIETENYFPTFTVKISNVSDRYFHFSQTFMNMYQKLDTYYENKKEKEYQRIRKKYL